MFGYLRYFLLISLFAAIAIAVLGGMSLRSQMSDNLIQMIEANDQGLSEGYVDHVWKRYSDVISALSSNSASQARNNPQVVEFAQETLKYFQTAPLLRVNIYNAQGVLLMTVNPTNSGRRMNPAPASPDVNFISNRSSSRSNLIEGVTADSDSLTVIQTLAPIRIDNGASEGTVEMICDFTQPWEKMANFQLYGTGGAIAIFLVFMGLMMFSSWRAESIIAKQHEANIELAAAAAEAEAENREKSQFLANVSHELRTPLNAIIGFSDIIKNEVINTLGNKKYDDYINDIHSAGVHLLSLINDILDYSKAEAGKLELEVSEVNVTKMMQNCMRLVSPRAENGQVQLVESLPKEPIIMITDSKKFKQVMLNLLSNAVKFTPPNGKVEVTAWRDLADDTFSFEVRDTGIGIAPKDISLAMSPFGQIDNALSRKYEGTGLGLPLTKKFVEIMGGKFTIKSEINVGTSIVFSLPRVLKAREGIIIKHLT